MSDDKVVSFSHPEKILVTDRLPEVLRSGASRLLVHAVEAEVQAFLAAHEHLVDDEGRQRVVRHGHMPEREVQTGIGPVTVRRPRVRDRQPDGEDGRIRFTSAIPPPYLRRTRSVEELLPWLYLKGISTGDFAEALAALLGRDAPGLSASTITRLKTAWREEYEHWSRRDLSAKRYVYFWADGVDFRPRMDHEKQCLLVIIGADEAGHKDIVAVGDGFRESEQSWHELLLDLKRRGLQVAPQLAVGDGALGFWRALRKVFGESAEQRCWAHKTANVLNKLPKSVPGKAKSHLREIWIGRDQGRRRGRLRLLHRGLRHQVRPGRHLPDQGSGPPADIPRIPRRAREAFAKHKPNREHLRHGAAADLQDQGLPRPQDRPRHGLQIALECQEIMAQAKRIAAHCRGHPGSQVRRRHQANQTRRLIKP